MWARIMTSSLIQRCANSIWSREIWHNDEARVENLVFSKREKNRPPAAMCWIADFLTFSFSFYWEKRWLKNSAGGELRFDTWPKSAYCDNVSQGCLSLSYSLKLISNKERNAPRDWTAPLSFKGPLRGWLLMTPSSGGRGKWRFCRLCGCLMDLYMTCRNRS